MSPTGGALPLSFDALFREQLDYVWRSARALVGNDLADDVTQEVFLLVRKKLHEYDGPSVRAWLYGITRNVARNAARGRERRDHRQRAAMQPVPDAATPQWVEIHEAATLMDRFLATLPAPQREAFVLKEIEELTAAEIAAAIGVPLQTVYSRVRAALAELERFRREIGAAS